MFISFIGSHFNVLVLIYLKSCDIFTQFALIFPPESEEDHDILAILASNIEFNRKSVRIAEH